MKSLSFKSDLALKLASLVLALLLWLYVQAQEIRKIPFRFNAQVVSMGLGPEFTEVGMKNVVRVEVRGAPEKIEEFKKRNPDSTIKAYADLSDAQAGVSNYRVTLEPASELKELDWDRNLTATITLEAVKSIPHAVEVEPGGDPPTGYVFGKAHVEPEIVALEGPESLINKVGAVKASLNLANIRSGGTYRVPVEVLDRDGLPMPGVHARPGLVSVTPALSAAQPSRSLLVSPKFISQPDAGYRVAGFDVRPTEILVRGERKLVSSLSILETQPIALSGLRGSTSRTVALVVPDGVLIQGRRRVEVRIRIEPIASTGPPNP